MTVLFAFSLFGDICLIYPYKMVNLIKVRYPSLDIYQINISCMKIDVIILLSTHIILSSFVAIFTEVFLLYY